MNEKNISNIYKTLYVWIQPILIDYEKQAMRSEVYKSKMSHSFLYLKKTLLGSLFHT